MFYAYTQNTPISKYSSFSSPIEISAFLKQTDVIFQRMDTNWLVISPSTGGWCLLSEQEYEMYQQVINGNIDFSILNEILVKDWNLFLSHLYNCGLIGFFENRNLTSVSPMDPVEVFSLTLILSRRCNLACKYCYLGMDVNQQGSHLSLSKARKAISDAFQQAASSILIDFGEIAVSYQLFKELVFYAKQLHKQYPDKKLLLAVQTNGTTLKPEVLNFLEAHQIVVGVSLDGPKHLNDRVRISNSGAGSHRRTESGLREIIRRGMSHIVLCTICNTNVESGVEIVEYLLNLNVSHFSFKPVIKRGNASSEWESLGINKDQFCDFLNTVVDYAICNRTWDALDDRLVKFTFRLLRDPRGWSDRCPTAECGCGIQMLVQNPMGGFYPCPRYSSISEDIFLLGHSLPQAINAAAQISNSKLKDLPDNCGRCVWSSFCRGGCGLARQIANSAGQRLDPYCEIYQHMYKLILTRVLPEFSRISEYSSSKLGPVEIVDQEFFSERER